jgi:hypothetical protein
LSSPRFPPCIPKPDLAGSAASTCMLRREGWVGLGRWLLGVSWRTPSTMMLLSVTTMAGARAYRNYRSRRCRVAAHRRQRAVSGCGLAHPVGARATFVPIRTPGVCWARAASWRYGARTMLPADRRVPAPEAPSSAKLCRRESASGTVRACSNTMLRCARGALLKLPLPTSRLHSWDRPRPHAGRRPRSAYRGALTPRRLAYGRIALRLDFSASHAALRRLAAPSPLRSASRISFALSRTERVRQRRGIRRRAVPVPPEPRPDRPETTEDPSL